MLLEIAKFPSFLWPSRIPLCMYTTSLSTHPLMDTWVVSISCLLYIMLLWNLGWTCIFELAFLFSLAKYLGVELLDHMAVLYLVFWGASILFFLVAAPIYFPTNNIQGFPFLHIIANMLYVVILKIAILTVWDEISLWFWFAFLL